MYLVSFIIGLIIVISSIFLIKYEFDRAIRSQKNILEQSKFYQDEDLFTMLESLQHSIDEMNRAFYEIAGDLEGKYSLHEREIRLINEKIHELRSLKDSNANTIKGIATRATIDSMNLSKTNNNQDTVNQLENDVSEAILLDRIIAMRSDGKTLAQIARELGIGMGELQLLLTIKK